MLPPMLRRRATSALVIGTALALAACSERGPSSVPPPPPVDTSFAVCAPPPDAGAEACACEDPSNKKARGPAAADRAATAREPQTPATIDPDLLSFLRGLGGACAAKDLALLEKSVRFPLPWRAIVNENVENGAPVTEKRRIANAAELCAKDVFAGVQGVDPAFPVDPHASPLAVNEDGARCRVGTLVGQFGATLMLEKTERGWILIAVDAAE
jgi:hypothetical protein